MTSQISDLPTEIKDAIEAVLDYLWDDEQTDYHDNPTEGHVFLALRALGKWIGYV